MATSEERERLSASALKADAEHARGLLPDALAEIEETTARLSDESADVTEQLFFALDSILAELKAIRRAIENRDEFKVGE
jgi:hypothetical protein